MQPAEGSAALQVDGSAQQTCLQGIDNPASAPPPPSPFARAGADAKLQGVATLLTVSYDYGGTLFASHVLDASGKRVKPTRPKSAQQALELVTAALQVGAAPAELARSVLLLPAWAQHTHLPCRPWLSYLQSPPFDWCGFLLFTLCPSILPQGHPWFVRIAVSSPLPCLRMYWVSTKAVCVGGGMIVLGGEEGFGAWRCRDVWKEGRAAHCLT